MWVPDIGSRLWDQPLFAYSADFGLRLIQRNDRSIRVVLPTGRVHSKILDGLDRRAGRPRPMAIRGPALLVLLCATLTSLAQDTTEVDRDLLRTILSHCRMREEFMQKSEIGLAFTGHILSKHRVRAYDGAIRLIRRQPDVLVETDCRVTVASVINSRRLDETWSPIHFDTFREQSREMWVDGKLHCFDLARKSKKTRPVAHGYPEGSRNPIRPFEHIIWHVGSSISRNLTRDVVKVVKCKRLPNGDVEAETKSDAVGEDMRFLYVFRPSEQFFPIEHENRFWNAQAGRWETVYEVTVAERSQVRGRWLPKRSVLKGFHYARPSGGRSDLSRLLLERCFVVEFTDVRASSPVLTFDIDRGFEPFSLQGVRRGK